MPLHGPDQDLSSRRILLSLKHSVYPLVVHHREAAMLGNVSMSAVCEYCINSRINGSKLIGDISIHKFTQVYTHVTTIKPIP